MHWSQVCFSSYVNLTISKGQAYKIQLVSTVMGHVQAPGTTLQAFLKVGMKLSSQHCHAHNSTV